ncbi:unnamed protein product [Rodentolepis nana]|uniref:Uncharacterized protein n=1 Tax=Rodentolepis nana TaxID=102285 RepID=A0A158QJJ5_RODNA|nr:unnamed protein product [Rodentolepis nana]
MSDPHTADPLQVPDIEITENYSSTSHLSSSVERLVEVTRRLTVCNQLESALESHDNVSTSDQCVCQHKVSPTDVTSELVADKEPKPISDTGSSSTIFGSSNFTIPDSTTRQSPQSNTKKWARLLGISPEDIGDEEEFIRAATALTAQDPIRQANTMSAVEQRVLRKSWNAALDAAHFGSLESMEASCGHSLRRSSSWKDKM